MTRKEQIAKKAAQAAALATYKAILNPPVWKVAGTSFKTSPTWEDIAKAAAAASYGAVLKLAQAQPPAQPGQDKGIAPNPNDFGMIGLLKNQPKPKPFEAPKPPVQPGDDISKADVPMAQVPINVFQLSHALTQAPNFAAWVGAYGRGELPADVANFVNYVKTNGKGESWAKPERWQEIVDALSQQVGENKAAVDQLRKMI